MRVRRLRGFPAPPVLGERDLENVVHRDDADHLAPVVHDRDRDQVVVAHQDGHVDHVSVRANPHRIVVVDVTEAGRRIRLHDRDQPRDAAQSAALVERVHAGERLGLQAGRLADSIQCLLDGDVGRNGKEVDAHQAARAGGIEAHQGQHLGALPGRQQVEHRQPAALRQLGDGIRRVVGPHPGQHIRDLLVGARAEQPGGQVLVEFLEDIRLQFRVGVHMAEDLGLFLLGRLLEQVSDLGRLQPAYPRERPAQQGAARVADERLEPGPFTERMFVRFPGRRAAEA